MKNNQYSLQLLHHAECFSTREDAIQYVNEEFKNNALLAEPAIVFYGDASNPNVIIVLGTANRKVFMIDTAKSEEAIATLSNNSVINTEDIQVLKTALKETVKSCGLVWDENKITEQITYEPNNNDTLIKNCQTLSEALGIVSKYVQEQIKEHTLSIQESNSVLLTLNDNAEGGKLLEASVKLSTSGEADDIEFNDNIIGVKSDGIFAAVNLHYDKEEHKLIFTTSGIRNGRFVDDAKKQIVDLGEHRQYDADNIGHTVQIVVDKEANKISADAKLSEDENNILVKQDGKLLVDGRANNIKYKNKTVFKELNELESSMSDVQESIEKINDTHYIDGLTTDTLIVTAEKSPLGNHKISGEVRLGNKHSIILGNGGLEANIEVTADKTANTLIVKIGDEENVIELPGIQLLKDVRYDSINRVIIVSTTDEKTFTIPVADLISTWDVVNDLNSPVELSKTVPTDGHSSDTLHAILRLASTNNLLSVDAHGALVAPKSYIDDKVADETSRAITKEGELASQIADIITNAESAHDELKVSIHANADAIISEENRASAAETYLDNRVSTNEGKIATLENGVAEINNHIGDIDSDIAEANNKIASVKLVADTNKEDVTSLKTSLNTIEDELIGVNSKLDIHQTSIDSEITNRKEADNLLRTAIENNSTAIETEKDRAVAKEGEILGEVNVVKSNIASEVARAEAAESALSVRISTNADAIAVMNGNADVNGSIAQVVKHTADDLKLLIDNEVEARTNADTALNSRVDTLENSSSEAISNTLDTSKAYTDAEVEKHIVKTTNDIANAKREAIETAAVDATNKANAAFADAKTYTDAESDRAKIAEKANTDAIIALQARDVQLASDIDTKVGKVEIKKNNDLQYFLVVDDVTVSEINIPKDQFLKSAVYNNVSKEITFTFVTTEGETTSVINISDLVDTYTAGNGLSLEDNKFSVKICVGSESYLTVGEDGLKLQGIEAALIAKADKSDVYSRTEADGTFLKSHQSLDHLATKTELSTLSDFVNEVSVKADANEEAIAVINGNEATEGSIAKTLKDANTYTDTAVSDIETVLNTKADSANVYTIAQADTKFLTEHQDISNLADKSSVESIANDIETLNTEISKKVETVEIVKNSVNDLQYVLKVDGVDISEINIPKDQFLESVSYDHANRNLVFVFETKEGTVTTPVYVGDLVDEYEAGQGIKLTGKKFSVMINEDSETYLKLTDEGLSISGIDTALATKANVGDSYTKQEIDDKNFLTEHQSLNHLATKAELADVDTKVELNKADIVDIKDVNNSQNTRLTNLESENVRRNLTAIDTDAINTVISKNDTGTSISSSLKINLAETNIIKCDSNGIYANVTFNYNKASNTITFDNGNGSVTYALSGQSLVSGGSYDSENKMIILHVKDIDGTELPDINIPVGDLVDTFEIKNSSDNPIQLDKTPNANGVDVLSASLNISNESHNAIVKQTGALYVSDRASDTTAQWGGTDTNVQLALNIIKEQTDKVPTIEGDISNLKIDVNKSKEDIVVLNESVNTLSQNLENVSETLNQVRTDVENLDTEVHTIRTEFIDIKTRFADVESETIRLSAKVEVQETKITSIEASIQEIKDAIGTIVPGQPTILDRLAEIEQIVNNLIDFGSYSETV